MDGGMKRAGDGGWAWLIVGASFVAMICTRSVTRCVSIFFVEFQKQFSTDYTTTSWINSLLDSTTMFCAPLGSYVGNRLSTRAAVMIGGLLSSLGLVLSCFAPNLHFLYISLGILTGLGFALSYTPAVAIVGTYFTERKSMAYGITMSGRGIGMFLLPPLVQHLIDMYSWRGALLILGGFVSNLCVCGSLMRPQMDQRKEEEKNLNPILDEPEDQDDIKTDDVHQNEDEDQEEEVKDKEHEGYPGGLMLIDTAMMETFKDSKQDTNTDLNNMKDSSVESTPNDSKLIMKLTKTNPGKSEETGIQIADLTRHDAKLISLMLTDRKRTHFKLPDPTPTDLNGSKADAKLAIVTLPDSQPLSDTLSSDGSIKQSRKRRKPKCCLFPPSSDKYSFLLTPDFLLVAISFLLGAFGCSVPFVYLVPYSLHVDIGHHQAVLFMSILGVMGIVGNISFGWISDRKCLRTCREVTFLVAVVFEGLSCLFVPLLRSFSTLVIFSAVYGFFEGAYMALIPVVTCDIVGSAHLSSALGVVGFLHGVPYLVSPPIAGWLLDRSGSYTALFLLSGLSLLCAALILSALAVLRHCCRGRPVSLHNQHQ